MTPVNPLSVVGVLLTLASLLGTFFYIQLAQWLRDLEALKQKIDLNEVEGTPAEERAIVEVRVELVRLDAWPNYMVNVAIIAFVIFIITLAIHLAGDAASDPSQPTVNLALWVFAILFVALSVVLFVAGWSSVLLAKSKLAVIDAKHAEDAAKGAVADDPALSAVDPPPDDRVDH
jgi:hypothetical protein